MKKYTILFPAILFLFSCAENEQDDNVAEGKDSVQSEAARPMNLEEIEMKAMTGQKNAAPKESAYKDAKIDIKIFENKEVHLTGFGYDILIFDALYVHQPHIPAINGNRGFKTKDQATKAAEFVIYKIRNNIMPPSLSVEELDSLGTLK